MVSVMIAPDTSVPSCIHPVQPLLGAVWLMEKSGKPPIQPR